MTIKQKIVLLSAIVLISCSKRRDSFDEELYIRQLPSGFVYSLFQFTTLWDVNIFDEEIPTHYNLFPKSLSEIISKFKVMELHLTLTQGRWRYNKWGYPIISAPTGVEMWVWFHPDLEKSSVDNHWRGLVHALSGQFCSSLNFIDASVTSSPDLSFKPQGLWSGKPNATTHLRLAFLPRETVCTENFTPWKKLLPCGSQAGLSTLLKARRLFDSSYHSLAVHVRSVCDEVDCDGVRLELKQTITSVFDPIHSQIHKGWSLQLLFGHELYSTCPVATSTNLLVDLTATNVVESEIFPSPTTHQSVLVNGHNSSIAVFSLKEHDWNDPFDVEVKFTLKDTVVNDPSLILHKFVTGNGYEVAGSFCRIRNDHATEAFRFSYYDVIPYFARVYMHTVVVKVNDAVVTPEYFRFIPGYRREFPASMEFLLSIPPQSTLTIEYGFEKVLLDWLQHPPDANHGYYISSSVLSVMFPDHTNASVLMEPCWNSLNLIACLNRPATKYFRRVYTEPLLITVALPDFSMPYNVICLTCTVIAIAFGSLFNITTKTFEVIDDSSKGRSLPSLVKERVLGFFKKVGNTLSKKEKIS